MDLLTATLRRLRDAGRDWGLLVLGLLGVLIGADVVLFWSQVPLQRRFAAYAPLSNSYFVPTFVTPAFIVGSVILVCGAALVGAWAGYRLGRRRRATPGPSGTTATPPRA
ncbi:MAG TPA: hypothetical protein VFQ74_09840 [Pseudolysinimonas sp.]|nr:hypothetical protein [Pseudolysinimonas sp.]